MTKHLLLLRHARAQSAATDDHARDLSGGGREEAVLIAEALKELPCGVDAAFVSDAARTTQTAHILRDAEALSDEVTVYHNSLYLATAGELLHAVNTVDVDYNSALLLGHNPGLFDVAALLVSPSYEDNLIGGLPTCGLVYMTFHVDDWAQVAPGDGTLIRMITPDTLSR